MPLTLLFELNELRDGRNSHRRALRAPRTLPRLIDRNDGKTVRHARLRAFDERHALAALIADGAARRAAFLPVKRDDRGLRLRARRLRRLARCNEGEGRRCLVVEERPGRAGDVGGTYADVEKASRTLNGRAPRVSLRDGLRATAEWYRTEEAAAWRAVEEEDDAQRKK